MVRRLGLVLLSCLALTGCTPGEYKGRVIVGMQDGTLVAVLGVCDEGTHVVLRVSVPDPRATYGLRNVARAERDGSTVGMRVPLQADHAPDGWSSDLWSLPGEGVIEVSASTEEAGGGQMVQRPEGMEVDLDAVPALPEDAAEQATEDC